MGESRKPKIFISYSHKDREWMKLIKRHFSVGEKFDLWHDGDIKLGKNWFKKIKKSLHEADVALLLISTNFLTSEFIKKNEVPDLLERCKKGKVQVVSIFIEHFPKTTPPDWLLKEGKSYLGFPTPDKPLHDFKKESQEEKKLSELVDLIYEKFDNNRLEAEKNKIKKPYKSVAKCIQNLDITKAELLLKCQKYIDESYINRELINCENKEEIIYALVDHSKLNELYCLINELCNDDLKKWLRAQNFDSEQCLKIKKEKKKSPHIVLVFNQCGAEMEYEVSFHAKDLDFVEQTDETNKFYNGKLSKNEKYDFNDDEEKARFVKDVKALIQQKNNIKNIKVKIDLVLPYQMLKEPIKLWDDGNEYRKLGGGSAQVNIIYKDRYQLGQTSAMKSLQENWDENILKKYKDQKVLDVLYTEDLGVAHNSIEKAGLLIQVQLDDDGFQYIFNDELTALSHIMLWKTKEYLKKKKNENTDEENNTSKEDFKIDTEWLKDIKLKELSTTYFKSTKYLTTLNLMFDNPYVYYYANQENNEGEQDA